jgi:hypothetical protein
VHSAVWPERLIVPSHPSEYVVVSCNHRDAVAPLVVMYMNPLLGLNATPIGSAPGDGIVATTVFVAWLVTWTFSLIEFVAYRNLVGNRRWFSCPFHLNRHSSLLLLAHA